MRCSDEEGGRWERMGKAVTTGKEDNDEDDDDDEDDAADDRLDELC